MAATAGAELAGDYDIVIVGGGMVGASLALQLSHHCVAPIKILVVESFPAPGVGAQRPVYSPSFDARSTALSFGSRKIFEALGLWPALAEQLAAIESIAVNERGGMGYSMLDRDDVSWPALGYVVENAWLGQVLLAALQDCDNVDFIAPAAAAALVPRRRGVDITITAAGAEPRLVHAQLAVVADGANSALRRQLGIDTAVKDYQQSALIANVSMDRPHRGRACERFTDSGPMALLPLTASAGSAHRCALVWTLPPVEAQQLCECDEAEFLAQLQHRFGDRQGLFKAVGERGSYPLRLIEAREQLRSSVVIMGNAAHSIHPVAGQGFNLALRDCAALVALLVPAQQRAEPLGALSLLQRYAQQQAFDQSKTIQISDRVMALFAMRNPAAGLVRGLGLIALDASSGLKQAFIAQAAGLHGGAAGALPPATSPEAWQ
ncbi:MAG: 2-octaprenyl-6-methoxyphenol hydroxylase [Paraglaciecola psychrophila]